MQPPTWDEVGQSGELQGKPRSSHEYAYGFSPGELADDLGHTKTVSREHHSVSTSSTAVICLASGIAAWTILPIIAAILAVMTGHQARREIKQSNGSLEGHGLVTVGLILGYLQVIPLIVLLVLGLAVLLFGAALHLQRF